MLLLSTQAGFSTEQTVEAIVPRGEQEIEPITPPGEQAVDHVRDGGAQRVEAQQPRTAAEKTASTVGKVVTGVTAAAVSLGAMAAMLIFL
jgi:hypothetical protein